MELEVVVDLREWRGGKDAHAGSESAKPPHASLTHRSTAVYRRMSAWTRQLGEPAEARLLNEIVNVEDAQSSFSDGQIMPGSGGIARSELRVAAVAGEAPEQTSLVALVVRGQRVHSKRFSATGKQIRASATQPASA